MYNHFYFSILISVTFNTMCTRFSGIELCISLLPDQWTYYFLCLYLDFLQKLCMIMYFSLPTIKKGDFTDLNEIILVRCDSDVTFCSNLNNLTKSRHVYKSMYIYIYISCVCAKTIESFNYIDLRYRPTITTYRYRLGIAIVFNVMRDIGLLATICWTPIMRCYLIRRW